GRRLADRVTRRPLMSTIDSSFLQVKLGFHQRAFSLPRISQSRPYNARGCGTSTSTSNATLDRFQNFSSDSSSTLMSASATMMTTSLHDQRTTIGQSLVLKSVAAAAAGKKRLGDQR